MTDLYKFIQKIIPLCPTHSNSKLNLYNVQSQQFICPNCSPNIQQQHPSHPSSQNTIQNEHIFTLKQISQNPILLMLKKSSFLSNITSQSNPQYYSKQFLKILTEIDSIIKSKKMSNQTIVQFLLAIKEEIVKKVDNLIKIVEQSQAELINIETEAKYLKKISKQYENQFLQCLESNFTEGSFEELQELFKKFAIQNQNPFRIISQKIKKITKNSLLLNQVQWNNLMNLSNKVLDPYIWNPERLFCSYKRFDQQNLVTKKQQGILLPNSEPILLKSNYSNQKEQSYEYENQQIQDFLQKQTIQQSHYYIQFSDNQIAILKKNNQQLIQVHKYSTPSNSHWDMMYQLPRKMFMAIQYQGISFYSYDMNFIRHISTTNTIKGCSQVLVYENFCIILAIGKLYKIYYDSLHLVQQLMVDKIYNLQQNQMIISIEYLMQKGNKIEDKLIFKIGNRYQNKNKEVILNLF